LLENNTLFLLVLEALGHNKKIYKDLDILYGKSKYDFYSKAKVSNYYNHLILTEGDIYREEYAKKALGILLYLKETKDPVVEKEINSIIRKGWPGAFAFVMENNEIFIEDYLQQFLRSKDSTTEDFNTQVIIVVYLAAAFHKTIVDSHNTRQIMEILKARANFSGNEKYRYVNKNIPSSDIKKIKSFKKRV
jgi:hypothetical protein